MPCVYNVISCAATEHRPVLGGLHAKQAQKDVPLFRSTIKAEKRRALIWDKEGGYPHSSSYGLFRAFLHMDKGLLGKQSTREKGSLLGFGGSGYAFEKYSDSGGHKSILTTFRQCVDTMDHSLWVCQTLLVCSFQENKQDGIWVFQLMDQGSLFLF